MDSDLQAIVNFYERDRGVGREQIIRAIELALEKVFGNAFKCPGLVRVQIDRKRLAVKAFRKVTVSDTDIGPAFIPVVKARRVRPERPSSRKRRRRSPDPPAAAQAAAQDTPVPPCRPNRQSR